MERKSAYTALAEWFEYLNDDCGYEKWSQYLLDRISAYSPQAGLDVGCGSGYFTRFFEEQGYAMTGLDVSREMLDKAERLALLHGVQRFNGARHQLRLARRQNDALIFDRSRAVAALDGGNAALAVNPSANLRALDFRVDIFIEHPLREIQPHEQRKRERKQNEDNHRRHNEKFGRN